MAHSAEILLTGATGLLGRYLLRDLLLSGRSVGVLVRDRPGTPARQRIDELLAFWGAAGGRKLPQPIVLSGDLAADDLGLCSADRAWVSRRCRSVLHAAACVSFTPTADGEPWRTNLEGTRRLLQTCARLGIHQVHHVSTAFVCGDRTGTIYENELDCGQSFRNDYERSKFEAELLLRQARGMHVTVYRPSVIVGDSETGFTSTYHGMYRFLALGDRLAEPVAGGRRRLSLRLPFTGKEPRNLVPVDWVAKAICRILGDPSRHARTYHLAASRPVPARFISDVAAEELGIDGVRWVGGGGVDDPSSLEQLFQDAVAEYRPYWEGDPDFRIDQTNRAVPDLPAPTINREVLARLIRFAVRDGWGRRWRSRGDAEVDCTWYAEQFFPAASRQSSLAAVPLDVTVGLDVRGAKGGRWSFRWAVGEPLAVERGIHDRVDVIYRLDAPTFAAIVAGRLVVHEAFFSRRVQIDGNIEKGLKLAVLFDQFVKECPYQHSHLQETNDACIVA